MHRVLMIAYDYPPRGWSGAQRTVKFVRYLPQFGWEPVVLAPKEWFLPGPMDEAMLREVEHAATERTGMITHEDFMRLWRGLGWVLAPLLLCLGKGPNWLAEGLRWRYALRLCPDYAAGWIPAAVWKGLEMIRRYRPALVYGTGPPHTDLVIGTILSRLTGLPFVADFRDLWVDYPNHPDLPRWRTWADARFERWVVTGAARAVSVTQGCTRTLSAKYPGVPTCRFTTVHNGFDQADMPCGKPERIRGPQWVISHVGSLYGAQTPRYFIEAVDALLEENPRLRSTLRLRFVGDVGEYQEAVRSSPCADVIETTGPVSHAQATRYMMDADVLLLIIQKGGEDVLTGKIFEYMASGRPILGTVPMGGEAAAMLRRADGATVVDIADVGGIKTAIARLHREWMNGGLEANRNQAFVQQFERKELTRRLAEVFDECVNRA